MPALSPCAPRGLRAPALAAALLALAAALPVAARCVDDDAPAAPEAAAVAATTPADGVQSRRDLQALVRDALARSRAVGAAQLLADAARVEIDEARAALLPQAGLSLGSGYSATRYDDGLRSSGSQTRLGLNAGAPLYDGGRVAALASWRTQLAEAARLGQIGAEEQVALQTVSLALDRARYRMQAQVFQQYARKMGCLVQSLQAIVDADKGRASELVQARKSQQQAELQQVQTLSVMRQVEARLRRFVGDGLPPIDGLSTVLLEVPALQAVRADVERNSEIAQLAAQAQAAERYTDAVAANRRPRLDWSANGGRALGVGSSASWGLGVTLNVPLLDPALERTLDVARLRAQAVRLQREDAVEARLSRMADVHEQAVSALDRARRVVDVLRDSERVRTATLQQWQQLGRRSLFDVMSAEADYYNLRASYVNALFDGEQANALLWSLGRGVAGALQ